MKKVSLIALALGVVLTGCSESTVQKVEPSKPTENAQASQPQSKPAAEPASATQTATPKSAAPAPATEENKNEPLKLGETVNFDGLNITVNSAKVAKGNKFMKPRNGQYVILDITVENKSDKPKNVSTMLQMKLQDENGYAENITIAPNTKGSVDGEVAPGRKVRGEVAFDIAKSKTYEFIFDNPFTSGQAIWKFEAK
ncbi:DUF4352 domain-containing protein [Brevibacillus sp. GCM10020057]|uniref:DUF4352 domain-containing protein n=1 Tax=Brevibacillus sp. GCM10020057 TaxID=3317327 RepID=UPI003644210F